jgi:hypothetical protein
MNAGWHGLGLPSKKVGLVHMHIFSEQRGQKFVSPNFCP